MTDEEKIKRTIRRIGQLPTLPAVFKSISELVANPRTSASDLSKVISTDPVIAGRLLRLVNSAFYGFPSQINTITRAIAIIGFEALRNLVLSTTVIDLFYNKDKQGFQYEKFWEHSMGCALAAKSLGIFTRMENLEELFVGGLLHDIGKLVHSQFLDLEFNYILQMVKKNNVLMRNAEEKVLGFTHDKTGAILLQHWKLPEKLIRMVSFHHDPHEEEKYPRETAVIHLADIISRAMDFGSGGDNKIPPVEPQSWELLNIKISEVENIMGEMDKEYENVNRFFKA